MYTRLAHLLDNNSMTLLQLPEEHDVLSCQHCLWQDQLLAEGHLGTGPTWKLNIFRMIEEGQKNKRNSNCRQ